MRYGIFSDVHSNLEALRAVIDAYQREHIDRYLCIGDIVGYAANPLECIQLIKGLNAGIVAGNHDWGSGGKFDLEYFNPSAKEALVWTSGILSGSDKDFLCGLPLTHEEENFVLAHGSLDRPQEFRYLNNHEAAFADFAVLKKQICFIGHTHRPGVFVELEDNLFYGVGKYKTFLTTENRLKVIAQRFSCKASGILQLEGRKRYIVNVGSVGQPRDRDPRAAYVIYDTDQKAVELKRITYDISAVQEKILNAGLPDFFASRLAEGK